MQRSGRIVVWCGMALVLSACSGASSDPGVTSPNPATTSPSTEPASPLDGTWVSDLQASDLEDRGFSAKQIRTLQKHDEWSSHQVNEISIEGDSWILSQGLDDAEPEPTGDYGSLTVSDEQIQLDEGVCFLDFRYQLHGDELQMDLVRSTCDETPSDAIPDFMYSAVFGQPFHRQG